MANELMALGKVNLSNYSAMYDAYKSTPYFSSEDWTNNASKGRLNQYITLLSEQNKLSSSFYNDYKIGLQDSDGRFYSMYNELYGDKTDTQERYEKYIDQYGTEQKKSLGKMSTYEYNKYLLNQQADIAQQELDQQVYERMKHDNAGWMWITTPFVYAGYGLRKLGSGIARGVDDIFNAVGSTLSALWHSLDEGQTKSFVDLWMDEANKRQWTPFGSNSKVNVDLFAGLDEALLDFERYYAYIRNTDGSMTSVGQAVGNVADVIGYMIPTILITRNIGGAVAGIVEGGMLSAGTGVTSAAAAGAAAAAKVGSASRFIFYAQQFSGTASELAQNTSLESVGSWAKMSNALLSTALEAGIEALLGKVWDISVLDMMHYGGTTGIGSALSKKSMTYIKGKPQINGLLRIAKGAVQEGVEEVLQDMSTYFVNCAYSVIDEHFYQDYSIQDALNSFIISLISSSLMSGVDVLRTSRYDTGKVKTDKDGNVIYKKGGIDEQGNVEYTPKTEKWGKLKTWTVNADIQSFVNKYNEIMTKDMTTDERKGAFMELYAGYRIMGQLYQAMGSEKFEKANKFLSEVIAKAESGEYVDVVSKIRNEFKNDDKQTRINKAEKDVTDATNAVTIAESELNDYMAEKGYKSIDFEENAKDAGYVERLQNIQEANQQLERAQQSLQKEQTYDVYTSNALFSDGTGRYGAGVNDPLVQKYRQVQEQIAQNPAKYIEDNYKDLAEYMYLALGDLQKSEKVHYAKEYVDKARDAAEKLLDAQMKTIQESFEREEIEKGTGEELAKTIAKEKSAEIEKQLRELFNFDKSLDRVVITDQGNNTVKINKTLFVPIELIRNADGSIVLKSVAENEIVDAIVKTKSNNPFFKELTTLYRELSGVSQATDIEAVYNMLYNPSFFYMALYASNEHSVELLAEITNFITERSKQKESNVYDRLYLQKLNEIASQMKEQFITYALNQSEFNVNNYDFLSDTEKKDIVQKRWGKTLAAKIDAGKKLTDIESKIMGSRINSLPIDQGTKDKLNAAIKSDIKADRQWALNTLDTFYKGQFMTLYNDKTYLVPSTKGSIAFNSFLHTMGLTIETLTDVPREGSDSYKAIAAKYKNVNRQTTLAYYNTLFNQSTEGNYSFSLTNGRLSIESRKESRAMGFDRVYYNMSKIRNLNPQTFKNFILPIVNNVNGLLDKICVPGISSLVSIDEVINEPNKFLNDTQKNAIKKEFQKVTDETTYKYLNKYFAKEGYTIVQLVNGQYKFASIENMNDIVKSSFMLGESVGKEVNIKDVINEKYLSGELRNTKIVYSNVIDTSSFDALSNTIYIAEADLKGTRPLKFIIAHEFQHAVQYFNGMSLGVTYNILTGNVLTKGMRDKIVEDIMKHKPQLFKEKGITPQNIETANQYLYYSSGEAMAYGLQGTDLFDYQPTVIGFNEKDMMIQFPWGSRYLIKRNTFSMMSLEPVNGYFNLSKEVLKGTINEKYKPETTGADVFSRMMANFGQRLHGYLSYIIDTGAPNTSLEFALVDNMLNILDGVATDTQICDFFDIDEGIFNNLKNKLGEDVLYKRIKDMVARMEQLYGVLGEFEESGEFRRIIELNSEYNAQLTPEANALRGKPAIDLVQELTEVYPKFREFSLHMLNDFYFPNIPWETFKNSDIAFFRYGDLKPNQIVASSFVLVPGLMKYKETFEERANTTQGGAYVGKTSIKNILGFFPWEYEIIMSPEVYKDVENRGFKRKNVTVEAAPTNIDALPTLSESGGDFVQYSKKLSRYMKSDTPAWIKISSQVLRNVNDPLFDVESYDTADGISDAALRSDIAPEDDEKFTKKYLSKKFVKGTNLEPFVNANRDYQVYMPKELQQFVYSTTNKDLYNEFPTEIARKIDKGILKGLKSDIMYYFMRGRGKYNNTDTFFTLVNDAFFRNDVITNNKQLTYYVNNRDLQVSMYAASLILKELEAADDVLKDKGLSAERLERVRNKKGNPKYFADIENFIVNLSPEIAEKYYSYKDRGEGIFDSVYDKSGKLVKSGIEKGTVDYNTLKPYARQLYMKYFDGSVASIEKIVKILRWASMHDTDIAYNIYKRGASVGAGTVKKGSQAGEEIDGDTTPYIAEHVADESSEAAMNAIFEDVDVNEAKLIVLKNKYQELLIKATNEQWSAKKQTQEINKINAEINEMVISDPEGLMKLAAGYELQSAVSAEDFEAAKKAQIAQALTEDVTYRGRGNVIRNIKRIASWINENLSPKQMKLLNEKYPGFFTENGKLNPDTFSSTDYVTRKDRQGNDVKVQVKTIVETDKLLELEQSLKSLRTAVREGAFNSKKALDVFEKLNKEKAKNLKLTEKYERKIAKLQEQIKNRYGVEVVVRGTDKFSLDTMSEIPKVLQRLLDTEFERLSPTYVQTISEMDEKQVTVSLKEFIDKNTDTLVSMEDADVSDIIRYYTSTQMVNGIGTELAQKKYAIAQMSILTFILQQQKEGRRNLSDADVKAAENLLYGLANNSANILSSWRDALKMLKPEERIMSNIAKAEGIVLSDEDVAEVMKAVKSGDIGKTKDVIDDLYKRVYDKQMEYRKDLPPKSKLDRFLDRVVAFQQTAMLSSPGTWIRNQVSNPLVTALNRASESIGNLFGKLFPKKTTIEGQYQIVGTKVTAEVQSFIKENVLDTGLLALIDDGISKYDVRKGSVAGADISGTDAISEMILHKVARDVFNNLSNPFEGKNKVSKAFLATQRFIQKMLTDVPYIRKATVRYFGKMLVEDKVDLSQGMSKSVVNTLAQAYTYAAADYMHKSNVFTSVERAIYQKAGSKGRFILKQFTPFLSASWNWFVKGLEYTPLGLGKAIYDYCNLEKRIAKAEADLQAGDIKVNPRMIEYTIKRKIGSGILGAIGIGIGALLGALGVAGIDKDDDDKLKLRVGNTYIDISDVFGMSTIPLGMMLTNPIEGDFMDVVYGVCDIMFDDFVVNDVIDNLRYTDSIGDWLLKQPESALSKLIPNALKMISGVTQIYKVKYDKGVLGSIERLAAQAFPGLSYAFPKRIDIYTGEVQSKYAIPFAVDLFNRMSPLKISPYKVSSLEKTAMGLGLLDTELTGEYKDAVGKLTTKEKSALNQKYGLLNKKYLTDFVNGKTKHRVPMSDGSYKELTYNQMTDGQRAYAFKGIKSETAKLAKVYVATELKGMKYYATKSEYELLKSNKIMKNVFIKTKSLEGFY